MGAEHFPNAGSMNIVWKIYKNIGPYEYIVGTPVALERGVQADRLEKLRLH